MRPQLHREKCVRYFNDGSKEPEKRDDPVMNLEKKHVDPCLNRREFLGVSAGFASAVVLSSAGTLPAAEEDTPSRKLPVLSDYNPKVSSAWIARGEHEKSFERVRQVLESATDFSWFSKGERILLKIALNSGNPFPATTDPWLLKSMIKILREKGAGEILVGDQSGVEAVHWRKNKKRGSSRALCESAGLLGTIEESCATPVFFEEAGYDAYVQTHPQGSHHWKTPMWISSVVNRIDHIIFVPRVASHIMGDITGGFKLGVGFLREDSRLAFHRGGRHFYAMYEEINEVPEIKDKLRLIVTSGRKVITTIGPDQGDISEPDQGLIFASEDLLANELLSYAWLQWNREFETSGFARLTKGNIDRFRSFINSKFIDKIWTPNDAFETPELPVFRPGNIYDHPSIINYMTRKGGKPGKIIWNPIHQTIDRSISGYLEQQMKA